MKPIKNIVVKISIVACMLAAWSAFARGGNTPVAAEAKTAATFNAAASQNMGAALHYYFTAKEVAESRIQKRMRKKKDPILIPYTLNKKSYSAC